MNDKVSATPTPTAGPVVLTKGGEDGKGKITPAIVHVALDAEKRSEPLVFDNQSGVPVTIVLPPGVTPFATCVHAVPAGQSAEIEIEVPVRLRGVEIPYWAFFGGSGREIVRDWGTAASPPSMVIGP